MKNKVRRNLKKNNKFNYKKHWLIFVGGRDFTVDETTPEQDIENFKAFDKLREDAWLWLLEKAKEQEDE